MAGAGRGRDCNTEAGQQVWMADIHLRIEGPAAAPNPPAELVPCALKQLRHYQPDAALLSSKPCKQAR